MDGGRPDIVFTARPKSRATRYFDAGEVMIGEALLSAGVVRTSSGIRSLSYPANCGK